MRLNLLGNKNFTARRSSSAGFVGSTVDLGIMLDNDDDDDDDNDSSLWLSSWVWNMMSI